MKLILFFFFCLTTAVAFSQESDTEDVYPSDVIAPKFNGGGLDRFYEFINQGFDFKKVKKASKIVASFTIDVEGNVKNIRIVEFKDVDAASEFIRVLMKSPKWESAKRGGKPFSVEIKIPLDFK